MGGSDGCRPPGPSRDRRSEAEAGSEQGAIYALEVAWRQWLSPTSLNVPIKSPAKRKETSKDLQNRPNARQSLCPRSLS